MLPQIFRTIATDIGRIVGALDKHPDRDSAIVSGAVGLASGIIGRLKAAAPSIPGMDIVTDADVDAHFEAGKAAADSWVGDLEADLKQRLAAAVAGPATGATAGAPLPAGDGAGLPGPADGGDAASTGGAPAPAADATSTAGSVALGEDVKPTGGPVPEGPGGGAQ